MAELITFGTRYTDLDTCLLEYLDWYEENESRVVDFKSAVRFLHLACNGRMYLLHLLRERIVSLRGKFANVTDLDTALDNYTHHYATNVDTITDPVKLLEFLKTATDDTLWLLHMLRTELVNAERKQAQDTLLTLPLVYR